MSHKEYISPEYLAQQFRDFLRQQGQYAERAGGKWPAEQHGNLVQFNFLNGEYSVNFQLNGEKYKIQISRREGEKYENLRTVNLIPKRSKTGRISREVLGKNLLKILLT